MIVLCFSQNYFNLPAPYEQHPTDIFTLFDLMQHVKITGKHMNRMSIILTWKIVLYFKNRALTSSTILHKTLTETKFGLKP